MRKRALRTLSLIALLAAPANAPESTAAARPNIIFVLIDDLRWDEVEYPFVRLPNLQRIAREGVRFRNAFVTTPLCSPSRASFLTGQYAHKHGITDNTDHSARSHQLVTFPRLLHDAGYETAFVGKWHMGVDDAARPGIDHWVSVRGQGRYVDPEFNINGARATYTGYFTDILNQFAVDYLKQKHEKPFLLYVSHKSVHPDITQYADGSTSANRDDTFLPAERHKDLYHGAPIPHRPNYAKPPMGKPALERKIGDLPPLGPETVTDDETIRKRLRMLASADEGLGQMLRVLDEQGQLENTLIVFTSDEGYFYGEHGLSEERRLAYEESARIPLYMRLPRSLRQGRGPASRPGSVVDGFALSIDVAPTLLEIGAVPRILWREVDGRSLLPLLRGRKTPWRKSFLIEYFSDTVFPRVHRMGYQSVRTERWSYIHYTDLEHMDELYDLREDPYQMRNLIADPRAQAALTSLRRELWILLSQSQ